MPSDTSREIIFAVARSHGAERPIKSPKDDIRSAPIRTINTFLLALIRNSRRRTTSTSICTGKRSQRFFQVVYAIDFLFGLVQFETDGYTCWGNMFEGR